MAPLTGEQYTSLPEILTAEEAAAVLGVSHREVLRLARLERVPGHKIGRVWRFSKHRLEQHMTGADHDPGTEADG